MLTNKVIERLQVTGTPLTVGRISEIEQRLNQVALDYLNKMTNLAAFGQDCTCEILEIKDTHWITSRQYCPAHYPELEK